MSDRLREKLETGSGFICLYGIAPPRATTDPARLAEIAARHEARFRALDPDGLIVYDIQDEIERTPEARPFPFVATVDPETYAFEHLAGLTTPKIVYRCVRRMTTGAFTAWATAVGAVGRPEYSVLVGGSSARERGPGVDLAEAYPLVRRFAPGLMLGGIAIAERHHRKGDEHLRVAQKVGQGCRFFVTQAIYDVSSSKSLLSDYALHVAATGARAAPIILTFAPCGSEKTMEFMKWLGIAFPRWLENELRHAPDVLERSITLCERTFAELLEFAREKRLPVGINVESVSIRKGEVDASLALFERLRAKL